MNRTRTSTLHLAIMLLLVAAGFMLWHNHSVAWDLGGRSPVLSFDGAQYALAGRELAEHGRLGTTFALPIELVRHAEPPWPLAVVQPGLVLAEGLIQWLAPPEIKIGGHRIVSLFMPYQREWLALLLPFSCYLVLGAALALTTARLIARHATEVGPVARGLAGFAIGGSFLLDAEAQHYAIGGFTELPYTLGLCAAIAMLAAGIAGRRPMLFGLVLGATGLFRGNMLWLAPFLALMASLQSAPGRRRHAFLLTLAGYALPLLPWWLYKWRTFGSPAFDLSALSLWDGVGGHTWFTLTHLPSDPVLPAGAQALTLIGEKFRRNAGALLLSLSIGPRGLWIGALLVWLLATRGWTPLRLAGWAVLVNALLALVVGALGAAWLRYLFPARIPLEAAGLMATWALLGRIPTPLMGRRAGPREARILVALIALVWGGWQTARGNVEARTAVASRGLPSVLTLRDVSNRMRRELPAGEPVMSNLGPTLSWYSRRPIVHLALTPADVDACRQKVALRHVVLVFRDVERAWPGWDEVLRRPDLATSRPEWNVMRARAWMMLDGFRVVWLELGPPRRQLARAG